jgi:DNA-directed RNA polymerase specialized sigma24 family protein
MIAFDINDEEETLLRMQLVAAVDKLPPKLKIVVALLSAGYTQQESANILGLTRGAIGLIFKRAKLRINAAISGGLEISG